MSFTKSMVAMGILGVALVTGVARDASARPQVAASTTTQVDDSTLQSRVAASIKKNATLAARDVEVAVDKGIVTLKGTVRTASEKARAARLATINGVHRVDNELIVDAKAGKGTADKAVDATKRGVDKAADATKNAAQKTVDKTKEVVSTTGEAITDGSITGKVKTKFANETVLKGSDINVDTDNHVVTLKGTVASEAAKARAADLARGTDGVTRVVNLLVVR